MNGSLWPVRSIRSRPYRGIATPALAGALGIALTLLPGATPGAEAQSTPRYGAGWTVGASHVTELNAGASTVGEDSAEEVLPGAGFLLGLHVDRWLGEDRRLGLRFQGSYQQPQFDWAPGARRIDVVSTDLSLLLRVLRPREGAILPYLAGGLGGIWYDMGTGPRTTYSASDAYHDGKSRVLPTGVLAIGLDLPVPMTWNRYPVGMRIEAGDHISFGSPLRRISDGERLGTVHHIRLTIGFHSRFSY